MSDFFSGHIDLKRLFNSITPHTLLDSMNLRGTDMASDANAVCSAIGTPQFVEEETAHISSQSGISAGFLKSWREHGTEAVSYVQGAYAVVIADVARKSVFLAVDRFAIQTLCYCIDSRALNFSDRADCVEGRGEELDPQAVFDYLFFHMIPAPRTIFRKVRRLP